MRLLVAAIAAVVAISFSDWLLFGMLFHERYLKTPELWRAIPEGRRIAGSMSFAVIGTAAFFVLATHLGLTGIKESLILALLCWIAASLPQTVTNTLYFRYDKLLVISHSLGWLARLALAGIAYGVVSEL